jgi:hypothetical protein
MVLDQKCLPDGVPFDKDGNPRKRYVSITHDRRTVIVEPREVADVLEDLDPDTYQIKDVFYSEEEFDELPEFDGF